MIEPFLVALPYSIAEPMRREYEYKCRDLSRWQAASTSRRIRPFLVQTHTLHQVFALGIYYRYVIAPLTSAGDFVFRLGQVHDAELVVGGRAVGLEMHFSLDEAKLAFQRLTRGFGLPETFFAISDVRKIVLGLAATEERKASGID